VNFILFLVLLYVILIFSFSTQVSLEDSGFRVMNIKNTFFKVNRAKPKRVPRFSKTDLGNRNPLATQASSWSYTPSLVFKLGENHTQILDHLNSSLKYANKGNAFKAHSFLEKFRSVHANDVISKSTKLFVELRNTHESVTCKAIVAKTRGKMNTVNRSVMDFLRTWREHTIQNNLIDYQADLSTLIMRIELHYQNMELEIFPVHRTIGECNV
jgi:hypothetical protein